ncbi:MAG: transposase [Dehalococcoidia bacterium]|nr:transposase [Dehalococcoidia bacterium]
MRYDPERHHRKSIQLRGYDYAQAGAYFVTICTQSRECIFGDVIEGQMVLNDPGKVVESVWRELPEHYPGVAVDACAVMPNHLHGIVVLVGAGRANVEPVGAGASACPEPGQPQGVAPTLSLPDVVQRFKSLTTAKYRKGVRDSGWQPFAGRLWQRNYYEHVIRNEDDLDRVRRYIAENPLRWDEDPENPAVAQPVGDHGGSPLRPKGARIE